MKKQDYRFNQDSFYQKKSDQVIADFFSDIANYDIFDIANFTSGLEIKEKAKKQSTLTKDQLDILSGKINHLLESSSPPLLQISKILNGLAGLQYDKNDLQHLNLPKMAEVFNQQIGNSNVKDVINVFNGFARLNFEKDEINLDVKKIAHFINRKNHNITNLDIAISLHSFAKMGYEVGDMDGEIRDSLSKIVSKAQNKISEFVPREAATVIHSLAKLGMFDELFSLKESISSQLDCDKILSLSSDSAFSLLQTQMICDLSCDEVFFDEGRINAATLKYKPKTEKISKLQNLIASSLPKGCFSQEYSVYQIGGKSVRDIDVVYKVGDKTFFIEVDGPIHYFNDGVKNSATKARDAINKAAISNLNVENCYYVDLPYFEIDKAIEGKKLFEYLDSKLNEAQLIEPRHVEPLILKEVERKDRSMRSDFAEEKLPPVISFKETRAQIKENVNKYYENHQTRLHRAVEDQDLPLVAKLIRLGADINMVDGDGFTLLHIAAQKGNVAIVEKLLTTGVVDIDVKNFERKTPLDLAFENGCANVVYCLVKKSNIDKINELVARGTESEEIRDILGGAVEANSKSRRETDFLFSAAKESVIPSLVEKLVKTSYVEEIFVKAINDNRPEIVRALIAKGVDVNVVLLEESAAFDLAANKPLSEINADIVDILINADADISKIPSEKVAGLLNILLEANKLESVSSLISLPQTVINHKEVLNKALEFGSLQLANAVIEKDGFDDVKSSLKSVLQKALNNSNVDIFNALAEAGSDLNKVKIKNKSFLAHLLASGNNHTFAKLVTTNEDGQEIFKPTIENLFLATELGITDVVKYFIDEKGCDPNSKNLENDLLYVAAQYGQEEIVDFLVKKGVSPNSKSLLNNTALFIAAQSGHNGTVEILSKASGIEIDGGYKTESPLQIAIKNNYPDIAEILIYNGANVNHQTREGITPVLVAVQNNDIVTLNKLISRGANLNLCKQDGIGPLHIAIADGNLAIAEILINKGADCTLLAQNGGTPLNIAVQNGHLEIVKLLFNERDKISNEQKINALHTAAYGNYPAILDQLIADWKISPESALPDGNKVMYTAASAGNISVMQVLKEHGVDVNFRVNSGNSGYLTPLHLAAFNGNVEAIAWLVAKGADMSVALSTRKEDGQVVALNPLEFARESGVDESVEILQVLAKASKNDSSVFVAKEDGTTYEVPSESLTKANAEKSFIKGLPSINK